MNKPYLGEIRRFSGESAPAGWIFCDGQELSVEQYQHLYAVIGVNYGGDGQTTFKLPKLHGGSKPSGKQSQASEERFIMATQGLFPDWI